MRYSNSGSIGISDIEKNAYRLSLTLEVTHIDAPRYGNLKTLPEHTHYGYLTYFRGSTVTDLQPVKFAKYRVFDIINSDLWHHYQSSELLKSLYFLVGNHVSTATNVILDAISNPAVEAFCLIARILDVVEDPVDQLLYELFDCNLDAPEAGPEVTDGYTALPVASPFPDIVKFKADIPLSFLWRLEAWYLQNPVVYVVGSPVDSGDLTEGEDEYPEPQSGDGDGDGSEFPGSDLPDELRDPRDFSADQSFSNVRATFTVTPILNGNTCQPYPAEQSNFTSEPMEKLKLPLSLISTTPAGPLCNRNDFTVGFEVRDAEGRVLSVPSAAGQVLYPGASISSVSIQKVS